ncbi:putative glycosyl transferase [Paenibacillus marchantiophytorum]|uniref:Glycosyl transferase n=1 Tax=Paenibacillus marchantiophytorum TaxID=1619310 RepID=A0ABQ1F978_9BACL|nr:glycosyltransferase [Paenibacillus marchantiophytorum]GGA03107.1 putative glycosyl transferase [Paenibacillus marchantiophytorum]
MLKIAYLDHTARWSGGEVALYNLITNLGEEVKPLVIVAEDGALVQRLRDKGIDVRVVPLSDKVRNRNRNAVNLDAVFGALELFTYGKRISKLLRAEQVACVHTNSLKSAFYGAVAAKFAGVPLIWHIRDHIGVPYLKPIVARAIRFLSRMLPNGVIANSNSTLDALQLPKSKKTLVVYSAYAQPLRGPNRIKSVDRNTKSYVILLVGRLAEWKGQHILLEAAKTFLHDSQVEFWLAGDALFGEDDYKQQLLQQMADNHLYNVKLLGHVDDIQTLMQKVDILVHTSITPEPFGQVIVEGMAAGLPVIASNEGGPRETVVPGETGLLITPGDPKLLAEAIRYLLENPDVRSRMSENGLKRVEQHFVIEKTVTQITHYYAGLIANT